MISIADMRKCTSERNRTIYNAAAYALSKPVSTTLSLTGCLAFCLPYSLSGQMKPFSVKAWSKRYSFRSERPPINVRPWTQRQNNFSDTHYSSHELT